MKRTPRASRRTTSPWSGPSGWVTPVGIVGPFRLTLRPSKHATSAPPASSSTIIVSNEMSEKRKYELKKRAERLADTSRRITEATVELPRTGGPAATHLNEVARRAGVQRMTVYNHFPNDTALLTACSAHWRALHP